MKYLLVVMLSCLVASVAVGADLTWDADSGTAGAQDGSGSWDSSNTNWLDVTTNNVSWTDGESAALGSGGTPGTVTLAEPISADVLTITRDYTVDLGSYGLTLGDLVLGNGVTATLDGTNSVLSVNATTVYLSNAYNDTKSLFVSEVNSTFNNIYLSRNVSGSKGPSVGTLTVSDNAVLTSPYIRLSHCDYTTGTQAPGARGTLNISNATVVVGELDMGSSDKWWSYTYANVNLWSGADLFAQEIGRGNYQDHPDPYFNWYDGTIHNYDATTDLTINGIGADDRFRLLGTGLHSFDVDADRIITVNQVVSGTGDLTKNGDGTLTLTAVNTFESDVTVNSGVLEVTQSWLGGTNSVLNIISGAKVSLGAGVNAEVKNLHLNGICYQSGTWGGPNSAAKYKRTSSFSGTGIITVLEGNAPASVIYGH